MLEVDVSIVIPVYNAGALINRCLDSVFSQVGNNTIEVILIDDGSTDNSVELINGRSESDRIRLFTQKNAGPAKARNKGIIEARGRYLAFLDADDYWMPEFINTTCEFMNCHSECIAVSVAQKHLTTSGEHESPKCWTNYKQKEGFILKDFYSFWAEHNHVCTGSIMIKTDVVKAIGGQREDLRLCEDLEFWALVATYGRIGFIPKLLFVSDGTKVTEKIGWVKKHLPRWNAAVSVEEWQKRLLDRNPKIVDDFGFRKARGRIARDLAYSIMMSKRFSLAKLQIKKFGESFPDDKMSKLLCLAVLNPLYWLIISRVLVFREYHLR